MTMKARVNMTMGYLQAFLLTMTVMWIPVRSYDAIAELSFTRGDTASIPCVFGEGTVRSIFWYYDDGTGSYELILKLVNGDLIIKEDRAELENDSTLILNDVEVQDEGTYRCDVDRQGQSARSNYTKLTVFSLSASSVPVVPQCPSEDESLCEVNGCSPIILTCSLLNIYPLKDAKLNWYRDGQYIPSTNDSSENEDGTFNMLREISASETGNLTCNATFLTVNGRENTAVYVSVCIIPDVRPTPKTNLNGGAIAGIVIGTILAVSLLVVIVLVLRSHYGTKKKAESRKSSASGENLDLLPKPHGNEVNRQLAGGQLRNTVAASRGDGDSSNQANGNKRKVADEEISELARLLPGKCYTHLCTALGFPYNYHQKIKTKNHLDDTAAIEELIHEWSDKKDSGYIDQLDDALTKAEVGGLITKYKK